MFRRRSKKLSPKIIPHHYRRNLLEGLERRLLMTTIITDTDPRTPEPPTRQFEYKDARDNSVRVVVSGDVSAEFIFAQVKKGATIATLTGDFVSDNLPSGQTEIPGRDLFNVYIAQASIDSFISIAEVAKPGQGTAPRPMTPFSGSISLRINQLRTNNPIAAMPEGTGNIYLGARTQASQGSDQNFGDNPIRQAGFHGIGIAPVTHNQKLVAGVLTAPGVSLGRFLFGGTISGNVNIGGSVESFYCGNLLTGVTEGQSDSTPQDQNNFHIGGDIHNLLVKGSIGTNSIPGGDDRDKPIYITGTDLDIAGRVQMIKVGVSYAGFGSINNQLPDLGLRVRQQELEVRNNGDDRGQFTDFENGQFGDSQVFFNNDTFDSPQFLGSINAKSIGNNSVDVNGVFQWVPRIDDRADYYAVPLMAGQTVNVRLLAPLVETFPVINKAGHVVLVTEEFNTPRLHVGVFDPDQRLIASDYSNQDNNVTEIKAPNNTDNTAQQKLFSFTADRPGIYRFAVGTDAPTFNSAGDALKAGTLPYHLQITGVGNIGLGGLWVGGTLLTLPGFDTAKKPTSPTGALASIEVVHGDLGSIYVPGDAVVSLGGITGIADGGDFRAIDALDVGIQKGGIFRADATIWALTGSVGMIRGTDSQSDTSSFGINEFNDNVFDAANQVHPIGGDVQYIVTNNTLITDITCNGSIGVIQANQIGITTYAGSINVNFDGEGRPGTIDLIDVTTDLGTLQSGGPDITTNIGGDVRYIRVGGLAFRPRIFGGGSPDETTYVQGQSADITDDSGAQVEITPTQEEIIDPISGQSISNSGTLTVLTYPIARSLNISNAGGGGSAIIKVTSTRGMRITASGGNVAIGEIVSTGSGPGLIVDPGPDGVPNSGDEDPGPDGIANTGDEPFVTNPTLDGFGNFPENGIDLRGSRIDVFSIRGNNFDNIRNRTDGEIVSANVGQVGRLEAYNLGIGASAMNPSMIVEGIAVAGGTVGDTFPFRKTKNALVINGGGARSFAVSRLLARGSIGNVIITGVADQIAANADGRGTKGVLEGITGAIFADGQIRSVNVGEGLLSSGSGEFANAGIYCISDAPSFSGFGSGRIEKVSNQGGSNIWGNIISDAGIGTIGLAGGGSIIDANIGVISGTFTSGSNQPPPTTTVSGADLSGSREFAENTVIVQNGNINAVVLTGNGGIIGTFFQGFNIDSVNVEGFGLMNCTFSTVGTGRFGDFVAGGYGFRGVLWNGGQSTGNIIATGNGKRLSTASYSKAVRLGETLSVDPFTHLPPGPLSDINSVLGTSKAEPVRKGASNSGSINLSNVRVSRDLGNITANSMGQTILSVGNNIGSINNLSYSDSLTVTAGRITKIYIGGDALRTSIHASGPVGDVHIGGSFRGTSELQAGGQNGTIGTFVTDNTLYGNVYAQAGIGTIRVGTYYGSEGTRSARNIGRFVVGKNFLSNARLQVGSRHSDSNGRLSKLIIEGDFEDGAVIQLNSLGADNVILGASQGTIDFKPWDS